MTPTAGFVVFLIGAFLLAIIAGLLAERFKVGPMGILGASGTTFVVALGLAMTAFQFLA